MATKQKPKKPRKLTPEKIKKAITMRAEGKSYKAIAKDCGVTHPAIIQEFKKDDINQLIKQAQTQLIKDSLITAVKNQSDKIFAGARIIDKINTGQELTDGATKLLELGQQCENRLLESVGIHPSHAQSIQITNILVDNRSELSPAIENMLISHLSGKAKVEEKVIEAEFTGTPPISDNITDVNT